MRCAADATNQWIHRRPVSVIASGMLCDVPTLIPRETMVANATFEVLVSNGMRWGGDLGTRTDNVLIAQLLCYLVQRSVVRRA